MNPEDEFNSYNDAEAEFDSYGDAEGKAPLSPEKKAEVERAAGLRADLSEEQGDRRRRDKDSSLFGDVAGHTLNMFAGGGGAKIGAMAGSLYDYFTDPEQDSLTGTYEARVDHLQRELQEGMERNPYSTTFAPIVIGGAMGGAGGGVAKAANAARQGIGQAAQAVGKAGAVGYGLGAGSTVAGMDDPGLNKETLDAAREGGKMGAMAGLATGAAGVGGARYAQSRGPSSVLNKPITAPIKEALTPGPRFNSTIGHELQKPVGPTGQLFAAGATLAGGAMGGLPGGAGGAALGLALPRVPGLARGVRDYVRLGKDYGKLPGPEPRSPTMADPVTPPDVPEFMNLEDNAGPVNAPASRGVTSPFEPQEGGTPAPRATPYEEPGNPYVDPAVKGPEQFQIEPTAHVVGSQRSSIPGPQPVPARRTAGVPKDPAEGLPPSDTTPPSSGTQSGRAIGKARKRPPSTQKSVEPEQTEKTPRLSMEEAPDFSTDVDGEPLPEPKPSDTGAGTKRAREKKSQQPKSDEWDIKTDPYKNMAEDAAGRYEEEVNGIKNRTPYDVFVPEQTKAPPRGRTEVSGEPVVDMPPIPEAQKKQPDLPFEPGTVRRPSSRGEGPQAPVVPSNLRELRAKYADPKWQEAIGVAAELSITKGVVDPKVLQKYLARYGVQTPQQAKEILDLANAD